MKVIKGIFIDVYILFLSIKDVCFITMLLFVGLMIKDYVLFYIGESTPKHGEYNTAFFITVVAVSALFAAIRYNTISELCSRSRFNRRMAGVIVALLFGITAVIFEVLSSWLFGLNLYSQRTHLIAIFIWAIFIFGIFYTVFGIVFRAGKNGRNDL